MLGRIEMKKRYESKNLVKEIVLGITAAIEHMLFTMFCFILFGGFYFCSWKFENVMV
jgi:hypothetical protein